MRTYLCNGCGKSIAVGHPAAVFRRQARALARDTFSLLERLLQGERLLTKFEAAMEEKFYLEPHHYRSLPDSCPGCGLRSEGQKTWWGPGLVAE